jgi:hypothetical protein
MLLNYSEGADFPRYFNWAKAFNQGNILCLNGNTISPMGVPLSHLSFGPGLIFSLASPFSSIQPADAQFIGWIFAVIFWIAYVGILLNVTNNNHSLTLFGACITFIGTPLGYYSSAYTSESLSFTCLAVVIFWALRHDRFSVFDYLILGIWSSLLIIIRSQLVIYLAPVYLMIFYKIRRKIVSQSSSLRQSVFGLITYLVPISLSICSISLINYWMTGSPFTSTYNFGAENFKSVDFFHPEILAVLIHPWHGLFVYHPLYLLCFASLLYLIRNCHNSSTSVILIAVACSITLHVWLHASWYVWWLGQNTFGMRGLSISGIILVPVLLFQMAERAKQGKSNVLLFIMILLMCTWSFCLLTLGPTQFYTYQNLISGFSSAIDNLVSLNFNVLPTTLFGLGILATLVYRKNNPSIIFENVVIIVLLLLVIQYQIAQLLYDRMGMPAVSLISFLGVLAVYLWHRTAIIEFQNNYKVLRLFFLVTSLVGYALVVIIFTNFSIATSRLMASKDLVLRGYSHTGSVDLDEVKWSYIEYLSVPGFSDKKSRLKSYLDFQHIHVDDELRLK